MDNYDFCFEQTVGHEGGFTNDPADRGNWTSGVRGRGTLKGTKYGVSAMAYPNLDIKNLTLQDARDIYKKDYWVPSGAYLLRKDGPALLVFDAAVNTGNSRARKWLQKAAGVAADGDIGPITKKAVSDKIDRDPYGFLEEFQAQRMWHHMKLDSLDDRYGLGWSRRLSNTLIMATKLVSKYDAH